jgi:hypothetical protein
MSNVNEFYNPSASPRTLEILRRIESLESSIKRITCSELEKRKEIENLKIDQIRCKKVKAELRLERFKLLVELAIMEGL